MTTVAIAGGAGGVGSSLAFNLLLRPEAYDVVVIDRRPEKVLSHVMDLEQVLTFGSGGSVREGGCDDVAGADVVVICAAAPLTDNTSRAVYLRDNAAIVADHVVRTTGGRVAVLDVDYHHGNGTQEIFYDRGDVLYVSLHGDPTRAYPWHTGHADETGVGRGAGARRSGTRCRSART